MNSSKTQALAGQAATLWALAFMGGCQRHERVPLGLEAYPNVVAARLIQLESLTGRLEDFDKPGPSPPSLDTDDGITWEEAEVIALFFNRDLRVVRAQADLSAADRQYAGLWQDPQFAFNGAELISPDGRFEFGAPLSLTFPISGRVAAEKDQADAAYHAELKRVIHQEWLTRMAVRRTWIRWAITVRRAELLDEVIEQVRNLASITQKLLDAGEITRVEGNLFPIELARREVERTGVALDVQKARIQLLGLMGLPPGANVHLIDSLPNAPDLDLEDTFGLMMARHPELDHRRWVYETAERTLQTELRKQYPDLTFGSGYGSENADHRWLLNLSFPIPLWNANRRGIARALEEREIAKTTAEAAVERLTLELEITRATLGAVVAQRAQFDAEILPRVESQIQEAVEIAELGAVDTLLLLNTVTQQYEAKSRLLDLEEEQRHQIARLCELAGPQPMEQTHE